MAEEDVLRFGYLGLFVVTFLSATLLPLSSEIVVALMPALGYDTWITFIVATGGNVLGALANYFVGRHIGGMLVSRYLRPKPAILETARRFMSRWGAPILFFSWVPIIGDPLTVVAGTFQTPLIAFAFWVFLGKALRYVVVLGLADAVLSAR